MLMESIIKIIDPKIKSIKMKPDNDEEELIYELKTRYYGCEIGYFIAGGVDYRADA